MSSDPKHHYLGTSAEGHANANVPSLILNQASPHLSQLQPQSTSQQSPSSQTMATPQGQGISGSPPVNGSTTLAKPSNSVDDLKTAKQDDKHNEQPKKKRKATIRACDACAIRKVRCDEQRPCRHCVTNKLNCTSIRERKKSGPKNLHKKTLATINGLSHYDVAINDANKRFNSHYTQDSLNPTHPHHPESSIIASNRKDHPIEMLPDSLSSAMPSDDNSTPLSGSAKSKPGVDSSFPYTAHNNNSSTLSNVSDTSNNSNSLRPKVSRQGSSSSSLGESRLSTNNIVEILNLLNELVINSIIKEITVKSLVNNFDKLIEFILKNINNVSLDYMMESNDPVYLSKILVILTLTLIIVENLTHLVLLETNHNFLNNNFNLNYFNTFKQVLNFKIVDLFQMIDKLLLYPSKKFNYYQIFYNQSVGCIHLFNYYNVAKPDCHEEIFINQQKVLYLRKSISYYQLININNDSVKIKSELSTFQLNELFEKLFITERYHYLTCPDLINSTNLFDLNLSIKSSHPLFKCFKFINNDDLIFHKLKSYNVLMNLNQLYKVNHYPDNNNLLTKNYINLKVHLLNTSKDNLFYSILNQILIFKVLMIYSNNLELNFLETELIELIANLNRLLSFNDLLYLKFLNYRILFQLIQILKINIDFENNLNYLNELIAYTKRLLEIFPTLKQPDNKILTSNKIVFDWFEELKKIDSNELFQKPYLEVPHSESIPIKFNSQHQHQQSSSTNQSPNHLPYPRPSSQGPPSGPLPPPQIQKPFNPPHYNPSYTNPSSSNNTPSNNTPSHQTPVHSLPGSGPSSVGSTNFHGPQPPQPHSLHSNNPNPKDLMPPPQTFNGHQLNNAGNTLGPGPVPLQLQNQLNKLQQSQINLQQINSNSSSVDSKDKSELGDLLQDFGNSKLSSKSSTNPNSITGTDCSSPEPDHSSTHDQTGSNNHPNPSSNLSQQQQHQQILQNSNSTSYSTIIQNGVPAPPVITPATATNNNLSNTGNQSLTNLNNTVSNSNINEYNQGSINVSESTKNLYNLFTQINDDVTQSRSNSLTNLFQFNNSSNNLNRIASLSNIRSSNNLGLINSNSTLNLFMSSNPNFNPPNTNPNSSSSTSNNNTNSNPTPNLNNTPTLNPTSGSIPTSNPIAEVPDKDSSGLEDDDETNDNNEDSKSKNQFLL